MKSIMRFSRFIPVLLLLRVCAGQGVDDCSAPCSFTSPPRCGTWLTSEDTLKAAGTYTLNEGVLNMTCAFSSLPTIPTVSWVRRVNASASTWAPFVCSDKDERRQCSASSEQSIVSHCSLRLTSLAMSGHYRCEAVTSSDAASRAQGSDVHVTVVGIQGVKVVEKSLTTGSDGYVEAEICAHPRPEVWWMTSEGMIASGSGRGRFAASTLSHSYRRSSAEGPAHHVPFCYNARLLVSQAQQKEHVEVVVRTPETSQSFIANAALPALLSSWLLMLTGSRL